MSRPTPKPLPHNKKGNCWDNAYRCSAIGCRRGELCDVCHRHDEPRGRCTEGPRCKTCDAEESDAALSRKGATTP
jgi:hypothetical protein